MHNIAKITTGILILLLSIGRLVRWFIQGIIQYFYNTLLFYIKNIKNILVYVNKLNPPITFNVPVDYCKRFINSCWKYVKRLILKSFSIKIIIPWTIRIKHTSTAPHKSSKKIRKKTIYKIPFSVKHNRLILIVSFLLGSIVTFIFVCIPFVVFLWIRTLPNPHLIKTKSIDITTKIYDRHGVLLYEIFAEQNRTPLTLSEIPDYLKQATIAIEDQNYYQHKGFSVRGISRAIYKNIKNNTLEGGSTITQQLIKSTLLTPELTYIRKIKELILALWAEQIYTKDQILEMYLNYVSYGGTAWGIEAASKTYFGKSAKDLTLGESALLAGLPAAPTKFSPFGTHRNQAIIRQQEVLRRMVEEGYITYDEAQRAYNEPLHFLEPKTPIKAPHFVLYIKEMLEERYGQRLIERGGLRIVTSLDSELQKQAQNIVSYHIRSLEKLNVNNGAMVITNPISGEILAMVGSVDYFDKENDGNVNVTTRLRQPGSSIKVINYAAALEHQFTAASIIQDTPVEYRTPGSPIYKPKNYDNTFHGLVPLRYALGNSYNIPAVRVLDAIGIKTMIKKGRSMGITSWTDESRYGLSLTLGGGDVTMLEMATVYGSLANNGLKKELNPIVEITDYTGQIIESQKNFEDIQAVKPEVAWIISNILSDNIARTSAFGAKSLLVIPGKTVSVKTGTSNDKRDNWTIGYTPSYVVTVWVGNNDNSPMDPVLTSGVTGATPIWHDMMTYLLQNKEDEIPEKPENIIEIPCHYGRKEYFVLGTEPKTGYCTPLPTPTKEDISITP